MRSARQSLGDLLPMRDADEGAATMPMKKMW